MTDTQSTTTQVPGTGRVEFDLPVFPAPDEPVLMQEDVLVILDETVASYQAVGLLARLLRGEEVQSLGDDDRRGLAALLEGIHSRLFLAVNGLEVINNGFFTHEPA